MRKNLKFVIALAMVLLVLAGCAAKDITAPAPDEGVTPIEVKGTCTIENTGSALVVSGSCNLTDGINLEISVDSTDGRTLAKKEIVKNGDEISVEFALNDSWSGEVVGNIVCQPHAVRNQPKDINKTYGKKFQNIKGENIIWNSFGNLFVAQSEILVLE